jgi:hypothetical protein
MHVGIACGLARLAADTQMKCMPRGGPRRGQWARHSPLRRTRKLSNVQESRLGRLNVCCKSRFFAEGGFDMPVTFAKGSGSVSACIRLFPAAGACASREPSETGLPLFVGAAELHGYLGVVNTNPFLQVKIEAYRGTKPPPRNLEFRARWKIGGFLVPQYDLCNLGRVFSRLEGC